MFQAANLRNREFRIRRKCYMWQGSEASYKTTYLIGLFGTGRQYVSELLIRNLGDRAKYFRDGIRLHSSASPMIYSGHVTTKYLSRGQEAPSTMRCILESVAAGFSKVIFVYRHPLDSLLTNWIWWRTYLRDHRVISGITELYASVDELCADLRGNYSEFERFAAGDPGFVGRDEGPRFLSFAEFVEETELHLQSATLAVRLEDFMIDPVHELVKILRVMSVEVETDRLSVIPPRSRAFVHRAAAGTVPQFREFIDSLSPGIRTGIAKMGYGNDGYCAGAD
jgi:hypothetical protein